MPDKQELVLSAQAHAQVSMQVNTEFFYYQKMIRREKDLRVASACGSPKAALLSAPEPINQRVSTRRSVCKRPFYSCEAVHLLLAGAGAYVIGFSCTAYQKPIAFSACCSGFGFHF